MKQTIFFIAFFLCALTTLSTAQQRFRAGLVAGLNASQINGDDSAGYNKLSLMGGVQATARLTQNTELGIALFYSQRGSQTTLTAQNGIAPSQIKLDYAEIPLTFVLKDWLSNEGEYYRMHFHAGFSYGQLLNASADDNGYVVDDFNNFDIGAIIGVTYFINENFGLAYRYNRSVFPLFKPDDTTANANTLWSYFMTFSGVYMF